MHFSNLGIIAAAIEVAFGLPQGYLDHGYNASISFPSMTSGALETITIISTLPPGVTPPHQGLPESTLPFTPKWRTGPPPAIVPSVRGSQATALETSMPVPTSITLHRGWPEHIGTLKTTIRKIPTGTWKPTTKLSAATVTTVSDTQAMALETSLPGAMSISFHQVWPEHLGTLRTTKSSATDRYTSTTKPSAAVVPFVRDDRVMVLETSSPAVMSISLHQVWAVYSETLRSAIMPTFTITVETLPSATTTLPIGDTQAKPPSSKKGGPACVRTIHPKPTTYCTSYAHTTTVTSSLDCKGCFPVVVSAFDRYLSSNWPGCMSGDPRRDTKTLKAYACEPSPPSMTTPV